MSNTIDSQRVYMPYQNAWNPQTAWNQQYDNNGNGVADSIWSPTKNISYYDYNEDRIADVMYNYNTHQRYDWNADGSFTKTQFDTWNQNAIWSATDLNGDGVVDYSA